MATIPVVLQTLNIAYGGNAVTIAFEEDNINFGDYTNKEFSINSSGKIDNFSIKRPSVTFTWRGAIGGQLVTAQERRKEIMLNLMEGIVEAEDLAFGEYVISDCYLAMVTPSAPANINGKSIYPQIELVYNSREYE